MKMPPLIPNRAGISLTYFALVVFILSACSVGSDPSEADALTVFKDSIPWQSQANNHSAELVAFKQTKTQQRNVNGRDIYKLYFDASIKHLAPGQQDAACIGSTVNDCGEKMPLEKRTLKGVVLFERGAFGWEPAGMTLE